MSPASRCIFFFSNAGCMYGVHVVVPQRVTAWKVSGTITVYTTSIPRGCTAVTRTVTTAAAAAAAAVYDASPSPKKLRRAPGSTDVGKQVRTLGTQRFFSG